MLLVVAPCSSSDCCCLLVVAMLFAVALLLIVALAAGGPRATRGCLEALGRAGAGRNHGLAHALAAWASGSA
jgi:hypothetical protein